VVPIKGEPVTIRIFYLLLGISLLGSIVMPVANAEEVPDRYSIDWSLAGNVIVEQSSTVWPEIKSIARAPFENPEKTAKWGLFIAGLVAVDRPVTEIYQREIEPRINYSLPNLLNSPITGGADGYLLLGVGSHYLSGVFSSNRKAQETSIMAGKAMAYSYLFAHLIGKSLTGRNRPEPDLANCSGTLNPYTCDPYDFGNWHGISLGPDQYGTAMPSFHFTMYFSVARVYARSYDSYWLPYTVMAGLLGSNIEGHKHWVSDMVAGALLGTFIGNRIYDSHLAQSRERGSRAKWEVYPYAVSGGMGLYLTKEI